MEYIESYDSVPDVVAPYLDQGEATTVYYRDDYADADKTLAEDSDDQHCWACSASNELWAARWGKLNNIVDEQKLYEEVYGPNFVNAGGHNYPALQWFLEGKGYQTLKREVADGTEEDGSGVKISRIPGGWYKDVLKYKNDWATRNIRTIFLQSNHRCLYECLAYLKAGYSVNINFMGWNQYSGEVARGGHAITMWGARTSNKYESNDVRHIRSVIVTDSDDYQYKGDPPNICPYLEFASERAIFEVPVRWRSCCYGWCGRLRGGWEMSDCYVAANGDPYLSGTYHSIAVLATQAVVLTPKPAGYGTPSFDRGTEEDEEDDVPMAGTGN